MKLEQLLNLNVGELFNHHVVKKVMPPEVISPDRDWKIIFYLFVVCNIVVFFLAGYLLIVVIGNDDAGVNIKDNVTINNNVDTVKIKNVIDYYDARKDDLKNGSVVESHVGDPSI